MPTNRANASELIAGLNEDLAHEYASIIQYRTYASTVRGPHRLSLRPMFAAEIADELSHAALLADTLAALGATPTTHPAPLRTVDTPVDMLQQALEDEVAALARYTERRQQAEAQGHHGLAVHLDNVIADETRHRDELQLVLSGWDAGTSERPAERGRHEPAHRRVAAPDDRSIAARPR